MPGATTSADNAHPLSTEGRRAAEALARQLSNVPVRAVYSSPYRRARDTVEPIAMQHGVPVRIVRDLRERRVGTAVLQGDDFVDALRRLREDAEHALPGGESTREVETRAWRAMDHIRDDVRSGTAVVGTHGGVISILRWSLGEQFTLDEALAMPMPAVFAFTHDGERWWVGPWNA